MMWNNMKLSLSDLLGAAYTDAVCAARAALTGEDVSLLKAYADTPVEFYPPAFAARQDALMAHIGETLAPCFPDPNDGAPTDAYGNAQHSAAAPLSGCGCFRVGEDGRLYYAGKSEHYHIPLGHGFPGYALIERAKALGVPNATHNNTRGYITRLAEKRLIAAANGVDASDDAAMQEILDKREAGVLNRVINLETGSLAVEAALKMMLTRFYALDGKPAPYNGRIPVFLVMADNGGGLSANYHGTTVLAQTLRGLWPELLQKAEDASLYRVVGVPLGDSKAFSDAIAKWNTPPYKTAGFCHEIIMMNYGGIRQEEAFLQEAYRLCRQSDTPVLCDEIQSCAWYDGLFLFRQYGLAPDFVSVGKGFPGGNYPASRTLVSGKFDSLSQFGALVTNGQEELASLAYLITVAFLEKNGDAITQLGRKYHAAMESLAAAHGKVCDGCAGDAHMSALCFADVPSAVTFCKKLQTEFGVDISAQTYKPSCPPAALTKLPLITSERMIELLIAAMDRCLTEMEDA